MCTCTELIVVLTPAGPTGNGEPAGEEIQFSLDLVKEKPVKRGWRARSKQERAHIRSFVSGLTEEDYKHFFSLWKAEKMEMTRRLTPEDVEAEFDFDDIENNGAMIYYNEILPHAEQFTLDLEGSSYLLADAYCLRRGCRCTKVLFSVELVDIKNRTARPVGVLWIEYKPKKMVVTSEPDSPDVDLDRIGKELLGKYPDLRKRLRARHERLRKIYVHCRKKKLGVGQKASATKVGRNDPCPCGSGRKYKKCCLPREQ